MASFYKYDPKTFANRPNAVGITIDGPTTKDMDDAILIVQDGNKTVVTVSIADVASQIAIGSADDLEAYNRGYTIYLPNGSIPMLPRTQSEDKLSLVPGYDRPALSVNIELDENLDILDISIEQTIFKSLGQWTYERFTTEIRRGEASAVQWDSFGQRLLVKRRLEGALFFYDLKQGLSLDDDGKSVAYRASTHKAQILIQEVKKRILLDPPENGSKPGVFSCLAP